MDFKPTLMTLDYLSRSTLVYLVLFICLAAVIYISNIDNITPKDLPWAGIRKEYFARSRTGIKFMFYYRDCLQQAYDEVRVP